MPPVLRVVAVKEEGIGELIGTLDKHFAYLEASGTLRSRRRERLRERVTEVVERRMRQRLWADEDARVWLDGRIDEIESGAVTPYAVADELLEAFGHLVRG